MTPFSRSSNWPRYWVPATRAPMSRPMTRMPLRLLRHVALGDALGQAFHDGGLAHAGLADEHRVVLGAPAQHLQHPADLLVPADDRVQLARRRPGPVRSRAYFSRAANFSSARSSSTFEPLRTSRMAASSFFRSRPKRWPAAFLASVAALARASSRASVARNRSPRPRPVSLASSRKLRKEAPVWGCQPPMALGRLHEQGFRGIGQALDGLRRQAGPLQQGVQSSLRRPAAPEQMLGHQFRMLVLRGSLPGCDQGFVGFLGKGSMAMISLRNPA